MINFFFYLMIFVKKNFEKISFWVCLQRRYSASARRKSCQRLARLSDDFPATSSVAKSLYTSAPFFMPLQHHFGARSVKAGVRAAHELIAGQHKPR